jgi:hypothetical protein
VLVEEPHPPPLRVEAVEVERVAHAERREHAELGEPREPLAVDRLEEEPELADLVPQPLPLSWPLPSGSPFFNSARSAAEM